MLTGYNGQISLGHGAFIGIGAYVATVATLGRRGLELYGHHPPDWLPVGDGIRPLFTIPLAFVITGVVGFLFGIPALRLAGVSLALATFALAVSLPAIAKKFENVTGGGGGVNLPLPHTPFGWDISAKRWLYYEAWGVAAILFMLAWLLVRGRVGRAWRAIRDREVAATASGVSPAVYKTLAFAVSSAYAGAARRAARGPRRRNPRGRVPGAHGRSGARAVNVRGALLGRARALRNSIFGRGRSGGRRGVRGPLSGALFGALVYTFLPIYAQEPPLVPFGFGKEAPAVVFGILLILIMYALPSGFAGAIGRIFAPLARSLRARQNRGKSILAPARRGEA